MKKFYQGRSQGTPAQHGGRKGGLLSLEVCIDVLRPRKRLDQKLHNSQTIPTPNWWCPRPPCSTRGPTATPGSRARCRRGRSRGRRRGSRTRCYSGVREYGIRTRSQTREIMPRIGGRGKTPTTDTAAASTSAGTRGRPCTTTTAGGESTAAPIQITTPLGTECWYMPEKRVSFA